MLDLKKTFDSFADEFGKFERIENPAHPRPDMCAFLMLDALSPNPGQNIICMSADELFLDVDPDKAAEVATPEQIRDLVRCRVKYSDEYGFTMFD